MKRKIKPVKFSFFIILFAVTFAITIGVAQGDKGFYLQVPTEPFRVVGGDFKNSGSSSSSSSDTNDNGSGFQGNVRNEFIYCLASQTNNIIDNDGNVIATESSAFFGGNPWTTFSLIDDKTGKETDEGGFDIDINFKCQTSSSEIPESGTDPSSFDTFSFPSVDIPLTVKSTELVAKVYSRDADGKLIETWNGKINTKRTNIVNSNSQVIGEIQIKQQDILNFLPAGTYQSWQHITVEGNIDVFWTGFPDAVYRYVIETEEQFSGDGSRTNIDGDLITYRLINVAIPVGTEKPAKEPSDCNENEIFVNGFCIKRSENPPPQNSQIFNPLGDVGTRLSLCFNTQGFACMFHQEFIGFTLFGIAGIIGIGAVGFGASNKAKGISTNNRDIYGMGY